MCECNAGPSLRRNIVAFFAASGETGQDMIRLNGCFIIFEMARGALGTQSGKLPGGMAHLAVHLSVSSEQRESRVCMILDHPIRVGPPGSGMARLALIAELTTVNIVMAAAAVCHGAGKHERCMARHAIDCKMPAGQRERCRIMRKSNGGAEGGPACRGVAFVTCHRQLSVGVSAFLAKGMIAEGKKEHDPDCVGVKEFSHQYTAVASPSAASSS